MGRPKTRVKMNIEENEKALVECKDSDPISYEWVFRISKAKYQEKEGRYVTMDPSQSHTNPSIETPAGPLSPAGYDFALTLKRRGVSPHLLLSSAPLSEPVHVRRVASSCSILGLRSGPRQSDRASCYFAGRFYISKG